jgi:hypothetical protein
MTTDHEPRDFWGYRGPVPSFKCYFKVGPVHLDRVPSWNDPYYPRFGVWRSDGGVSLRYRSYILRVR